MLNCTFLHIRQLGAAREAELWREGILSHDDLVGHETGARLEERWGWYEPTRKALAEGDPEYILAGLPTREHFRAALTYPAETVFLDIETTGLSPDYEDITIVGWSLGGRFGVIVVGRDDPRKLFDDLARAKALCTFNGKSFDMRFIMSRWPETKVPAAHADLRHVARRAGYAGGQKRIEEEIGLERDTGVSNGEDAVRLWWEYRDRGRPAARRREALRELINYNHLDVEGMKHVFEAAVARFSRDGTLPRGIDFGGRFSSLVQEPFTDPETFPFSLETF
ncbi:MAG: ribonuclease H-like domain-containing protein [Deltaproteobacteria bacterium]|jgi:uncharacterized protein YprB with RNaseH-like and TPR domain|nr:ribonuclease H-like domain-containing protein [Deltaproteobacteria bacterium]